MDPVFARDAGIVLGGRDEFAFLQNPYGADVVLGHEGIKRTLNAIFNLQNDLRLVLHLHREGQRSFAKKAHPVKKRAQLKPEEAKIVQIRA